MFVYKIKFDEFDDFYIGSAKNLKRRMYEHKTRCKNNFETYNCKLYNFIRENNLLEKIIYEILESPEDTGMKNLREREQYYIELLKPKLNSIPAWSSPDKKYQDKLNNNRKIRARRSPEKKAEDNRKSLIRNSVKYNCSCGKDVSIGHKSRHNKTLFHLKNM